MMRMRMRIMMMKMELMLLRMRILIMRMLVIYQQSVERIQNGKVMVKEMMMMRMILRQRTKRGDNPYHHQRIQWNNTIQIRVNQNQMRTHMDLFKREISLNIRKPNQNRNMRNQINQPMEKRINGIILIFMLGNEARTGNPNLHQQPIRRN